MLRVYNAAEKLFNHNGLKILKPLSAEIYKEDNGDYYLDLETFIDDMEWVLQDNIVTSDTPWGIQGFRLGNPEISNNIIKVRAKHLYFDSANYLIEDAYPQNQTAAGALSWVLARTDQSNPFTGSSDIGDVHSARYVRKTLEEVITSMIETWNGHLERDNFNISIKQNIGQDRGVTIAYSKNLTEFKAVENWDNVVTKLLPVGNDGVMLPEKYLISDVQYDIPYTKTVSFSPSEEIDTEDEAAVIRDLRTQAQAFLDANKYPKVNYTVNAHIENVVDIGDTIQVIHNKSNTNLLTSVIAVKYDCILNKFKSIQFGNFKNNLKSLIKSIGNQIETVKNDSEVKYSALELALQESKDTIMKYLTVGHKYITENAIYFLDTPDPATAQNFMIISLGGIGFGHNGINNGYVTAWTIDGKFNADFITTGTIRALNIESTNINNNNKFIVDALGNMTANNAVLNNGTFSGAITGGTLNINNRFIVDSNGNMTATNAVLNNGTFSGSITSNSATITGGSFLVNASGQNDTRISLSYGNFYTGLYPYGLVVKATNNGNYRTDISPGNIYLGDPTTTNNTEIQYSGITTPSLLISNVAPSMPGHTHTTSTTINASSNTDGQVIFSNGINAAGWNWVNNNFVHNTSSDIRLKKNYRTLEELPIALYMEIKPYLFDYKEEQYDEGCRIGFVAQQVEQVFQKYGLNPFDYNLVQTRDPQEGTNENEYVFLDGKVHYVNYTNMHAWTTYVLQKVIKDTITPATSVIQEQADKIESLENKIEALEQRLSKLEVA